MEDNNYYNNNGSISSSSNHNNISSSTNITTTTFNGPNLEFPTQQLYSGTHMGEVANNEGSMDIILEDLLRDAHVHNNTTRTCHPHLSQDFNNHTNSYIQLSNEMPLSGSPNEDKSSENDESTQVVEKRNKKRVRREKGDNKEAVRRYREKLKARETALEEEVTKLKASNQELLKRLQGEAAMQDEIYLLKCLLVDIRGRIEGEIHSFRFLKPSNNSNLNGYNNHMNHCNGHCTVVGGKRMQSGQISYDQGSNGGESDKANVVVREPKQILNFKRDV